MTDHTLRAGVAQLEALMRQHADDVWHLSGHQDCARTLGDYADRVAALLQTPTPTSDHTKLVEWADKWLRAQGSLTGWEGQPAIPVELVTALRAALLQTAPPPT